MINEFEILPEIDFIEETQEEFDARMVEVKEKWQQLDKEFKEYQELVALVTEKYPTSPEFEKRLERFIKSEN